MKFCTQTAPLLALGKEQKYLTPYHGENIAIISRLSHFISWMPASWPQPSRCISSEQGLGCREMVSQRGEVEGADEPRPGGEMRRDWA